MRVAKTQNGLTLRVIAGSTPDPADETAGKNDAAAHAAGLDPVCVRRSADPQGAILHNKFVVLLKKTGDASTAPYYVAGSLEELDRQTFAGTGAAQ
jgi:hypothetical protein